MKTRQWLAHRPDPMMRRRLPALLTSALLVIGIQLKWTDGLGAAPALRVSRNRAGAEVVQIDARNIVHYLSAGGPAPPRPPRPPVDPDLKPGFPVQALHTAGGSHGGPAVHTLIGEIDGDSQLEIIATGLSGGPLYAWNHDGTPVSGWPVGAGWGAGYPAVLEDLPLRRAVVAGYFGPIGQPSILGVYAGNGSPLPGWPIGIANYIATPPSVADVDGVGPDEIFTEEEDWQLHAYRLNATVLPGWPVSGFAGQERHTPAIADLDGDGNLEIVTASGWMSSVGVNLFAYHQDGRSVSGFPVIFDDNGLADYFPVIGDVDGDGQLEIVVVSRDAFGLRALVFSSSGALERTIRLAADFVGYGTMATLADLDGDGVPEILVQTDGYLNVFHGDGRSFPGWPVYTGGCVGNSAPVVGDVDGDPRQEIVITTYVCGQAEVGEVRVYHSDGTIHPHFPKTLNIGFGAVPAIADIDRDGRNDIVVCGSYWNGFSGFYDKCWAYDLGGGHHGKIEWGQFGGNAAHSGRYPVPAKTAAIGLYSPATGTFYIRNANSAGVASTTFTYGPAGAGWVPLVGDWNGDGIKTVGLYNPAAGVWYLRNSNTSGIADLTFAYGPAGAGWVPVVGDWNGDGIDTVALSNPATGVWYLRNSNTAGTANLTFTYGPAGLGWTSLAGDWDGL